MNFFYFSPLKRGEKVFLSRQLSSFSSSISFKPTPPVALPSSLTHALMNALLARQRCPCSADPRQHSPARNQARLAVANRTRISKRNDAATAAAFRTTLGGGGNGETKAHDGSSPFVLQAGGGGGGAASLRLEERAGRVYATAELGDGDKKSKDEDDLFFGPPPPTGVFLSGAELRPGTSYLLSPGAEISFTDPSSGKQTSVTVDYEVSESSDGIGGLGEMLARAMAAQASDEVKAKLDDVF